MCLCGIWLILLPQTALAEALRYIELGVSLISKERPFWPSTYSSGGKTHHGSITKQGSRCLRWILVELSTHAVKGSKKEDLHTRVAAKHGKAAARVAVAREMLKVIFYMLKRNEPFMKDYSRKGNLAAISLVS